MSDAFLELARTGKLPSPSGVGARILSLTQDESATVDDIATVLGRDPALTGRILRVANSATLAGSQPLTTTKQAAMRLGLRAVSSIAVGFTLVSSNRDGACEGFDYPSYWSRSIATAAAAQALARASTPELAPEAFTAGLLFEIGQLGFATAQPIVYSGVRASWSGDPEELLELEQRALGIDHATLASKLITEWGMQGQIPEAIEMAVRGLVLDNQLASILATASHLSRYHIGKPEPTWPEDAELAALLNQMGLDLLDFASDLPSIELEWREFASDLGIKPLPPAAPKARAQSAEATPKAERTRVLVVDDSPICLKVLVNCLERAGHQVVAASSGEEGLALALQHEPDVLVTDWQMPGMDGLALCRALRRCEVGRRLFIVVLTGLEDEDACIKAFDAEADEFIRKPYHPRELVARVEVGLRLVDAQSQLASGESKALGLNDISAADTALGEDSGRDPLTGLPNRIFATSRLTTLFEDRDQPLSLIALTIDQIGAVESTLIAQDLTRQLADQLKHELRKDDVVTCTSGGHFLLLCPGATLFEAAEVAERLRIGVRAKQIRVQGHTQAITISAGVAERTDALTSPAALIILAETALEIGAMDAPDQIHPAA